MNTFDIIVIVLLLAGAVRGFMRGFVYEIATLGSLFLGMFAAFKLAYLAQPALRKIGNMDVHLLAVLSFILMFLVVVVSMYFLAKLFTSLIDKSGLGIFNKLMGAVFGILKFAFILSILIYFFNHFNEKHHYVSQEKKSASKLYQPIADIAPAVLPVLNQAREKVEEKFQ
jgi:membrane protein required for colicin V production